MKNKRVKKFTSQQGIKIEYLYKLKVLYISYAR